MQPVAMRVFISRHLSETSEFHHIMQDAGWMVEGFSLIELRPLAFGRAPECDWIFFSSKNAVRFFYEGLEQTGKVAPGARLAAIGPGTAAALLHYAGSVDFTGDGDPETTAALFRQLLPAGALPRVLFPGALHSRQSIQQLLGKTAEILYLPVYENTGHPHPPASSADALVFTSPLNARTYFSRHTLLAGQQVFAIGRPTAQALADMGIPNVVTAAQATERNMAETVLRHSL